MARIRRIFWIPDWGFLDEPVMLVGPFIFSWRRIFGLFTLVLAAIVLRMGSKMPIPGSPLGLDQILFLGATAGLSLLLLAPQGAVPIEHQLAGLLFPSTGGGKKKERSPRQRDIVVKTDVLPYSLEVSGYAIDPRTGDPLRGRVLITVDGKETVVEPGPDGKYRAVVDLGEGVHEIVVMLEEPKVELKRLKIKVVSA